MTKLGWEEGLVFCLPVLLLTSWVLSAAVEHSAQASAKDLAWSSLAEGQGRTRSEGLGGSCHRNCTVWWWI